MYLTQITGPTLGRKKPKGRKNSTLKPGKRRPQNNKLKEKIMKRQRNTTQMKEQTRNTEVQIKEEKTGTIPEKEFRVMILKMINNLENRMEKIQESINKDLEELKNKPTGRTAQLLKLKVLCCCCCC